MQEDYDPYLLEMQEPVSFGELIYYVDICDGLMGNNLKDKFYLLNSLEFINFTGAYHG